MLLVAPIVVPLSMQRDFSSLSFTSGISVTADAFLVVFVAVFAPVASSVAAAGGFGQVLGNSWINSGFFIGFGVLTIAMTCQHSAFIVAVSLQNLTASRWARVTFISLTLSAILCLILGVTGYLGFTHSAMAGQTSKMNERQLTTISQKLVCEN